MSEAPSPRELRSLWKQICQRNVDQVQKRKKLHISASFTVDPLVPYLGALANGVAQSGVEISLAEFGQVAATLAEVCATGTTHGADCVVIGWRMEDFGDGFNSETYQHHASYTVDLLQTAILSASVPVYLMLPPPPRPSSLSGIARPDPLWRAWLFHLQEILAIEDTGQRLRCLDGGAILSAAGGDGARDLRKEQIYRQPFSETFYVEWARQLTKLLKAEHTEAKKCLVLDCDNTLWGGVIGDDGLDGLKLSDEFPSRVYREFQKRVKTLAGAGVMLAIASKNDLPNVMQVFREHDAMILKEPDISVFQVHWGPKSQSMRAIANELNIGLSALVFIDDSPVECAEVRAETPDVTVLQVPENIEDLPGFLDLHAALFDRVTVTEEDLARVSMIRAESLRRQVGNDLASADFLTSLDLRVSVGQPSESQVERVVQLINKTNQFNVMTRRRDRASVQSLVNSPDHLVLRTLVQDKFGDYGLVGVALISLGQGPVACVTDLLMSCRVLQRGVETAMMYAIAHYAREAGATTLRAAYVPTLKNSLVRNLFIDHSMRALPHNHQAYGQAEWTGTGEITIFEAQLDDLPDAPSHVKLTLV